MSIPSKTRKDQKAHEHSSKSEQGAKSIKKPMSIPSKTRKHQKTNEHSSKSEQGVQKHQKTNEHTIKNKKTSKSP